MAALLVFSVLVGGWIYSSRPVAKVVRVVRGQAVDAVPGSVIVDAEYQMDIKSEVGGRIIKSALAVGDHVKDGDFLVQLDTGDLKLDIEKTKSDYEALKNRIAVGSQIQLQLDSARADLANNGEGRVFTVNSRLRPPASGPVHARPRCLAVKRFWTSVSRRPSSAGACGLEPGPRAPHEKPCAPCARAQPCSRASVRGSIPVRRAASSSLSS